MSKVFIGGSRRLSRLNKDVKIRLDNIVKNSLTVLIGDANGADKAVQQYLASKHYQDVIVYCVGARCRNNVGNWPVCRLSPPQDLRRDFSYYATKDRAMVDETDYGLMLWDGNSRGTLTSIVDLMRHGKPAVVYVAPRRTFETVRYAPDLASLLGTSGAARIQQAEGDLHAAGRPPAKAVKLTGTLPLF